MNGRGKNTHQIKTPPGNPGAMVDFGVPAIAGLAYFFFLAVDFLADEDFFAPPDFLVAFFIERFSLT